MKRRNVYLKLTRHNGRAGAHGTYNPKHNDRSFNLANSEHIDPERAKGNIYWDCFHGFRSALDPQDPNDLAATFSDVERQFYETRYTAFIESQNERNAKIRHTERNRSIPDLLSSRKTCPEETIYQLGTLDEHASAEDLLNIVTEFIEAFKAKFGEHVHVLDWALHLDESTPHIHERHVFDCENKYGEVAPQQEKALEVLGFNLPDPDKPLSRRNNRKITFDAACREMLFEIAKRHGLPLVVDATFATPYLLRPFEHGADIVVHSLTKWLGGHGTALGGIVVDGGTFDWTDSRFSLYVEPDASYHYLRWGYDLPEGYPPFITRMRLVPLRNLGACISPDNAWMILQGLETLPLRMERHCANALKVAYHLKQHPKVAWVRYPGLPDDPAHAAACRMLRNGFGGMVVFGIQGGQPAGQRFIEKLGLFSHLANVGDAKSLALHPASTSHAQLSEEQQRDAGLPPELIRLSIGIEHIDDILEDLDQALGES